MPLCIWITALLLRSKSGLQRILLISALPTLPMRLLQCRAHVEVLLFVLLIWANYMQGSSNQQHSLVLVLVILFLSVPSWDLPPFTC